MSFEPKLRLGKQTGFGVEASVFKNSPRGETALNQDGESEIKVNLGGRGQSIRIKASTVYSGSSVIPCGFALLKEILTYFCGKGSDAVAGKITPNLNYETEYLTLDLIDENEGLRFRNVVISAVTLSVTVDGALEITIEYFANGARELKVLEISGGESINTGEDILSYLDIKILWGEEDVTKIFKSKSINLNNNIDPRKFNVLGSTEYQSIRFGDLTTQISGEALYLDNKFRKDLWGGASDSKDAVSSIKPLSYQFTDKLTGDKLILNGQAKLITVDKTTPVGDVTSQSVAFDFVYTNGKLFDIDIIEV